jgi:hypothetical protein
MISVKEATTVIRDKSTAPWYTGTSVQQANPGRKEERTALHLPVNAKSK